MKTLATLGIIFIYVVLITFQYFIYFLINRDQDEANDFIAISLIFISIISFIGTPVIILNVF